MSKLNGQWLEIFRAGDYGEKGVFTAAQLAALASSYNPQKDEAPIVVGHPELDAPAFGWVKQLRMEGDTLLGLPGEVNPDFEEAVKTGAYKKRSVAFTRQPDGSLRLRHLGFLGAAAPHIKGLRDARFSAGTYEEIEFSEANKGDEEMDEAQVKKTVTDSIKEFFAQLTGGQKSATVVSQADMDAAAKRAADAVEAKFADELKKEREARQAIETKFAEHQKQFGSQTAAQRVAATISGLKERKHWIPAFDKMGVPQLFAQLAAAPVEIEFGEGDKVVKKDAVQVFADILDGIGKIVPEGTVFSETAGGEKKAVTPDTNGGTVDASSVTFNEQVEAYAKEHKVEFVDAYRALAAQGKRPEAGAASAGAV